MAVERPTFHEAWYRVAELHPRLRTTVQISRQHFRAQAWHVVQDHTNNAFFRLAEPAYRFIGLLDGKRTVAEAWKMVNEQLGDDAPTQGEVIQLLGQLYTSNLLQSEVPADAHTLFARYKKRRNREVTSYLMNIMFARFPLIDPDAFLEKWIAFFGWIFSPAGLVLWLVLIGGAIYEIAGVPGWQAKLFSSAGSLLSPENLVLLGISFWVIKACHEMGHAISCKKFGRQSGTGGEVHVIGIMLLVFTPVPYVDASSSWALQNKWHRAIVGAAGMWVELAIASLAAMTWANTGESSWVHAFAYNVMFVASFSTVIFNANPLLRYDGYYILADLLEIPNLAQRSNEYIYYLVKRYVWNVRFVRNPAYSVSEQGWLFVYAVSSFLMRAVVSFSIMFYLGSVLGGALIILAAAMGIAAVFTWVLMPVGRFLHYLVTSQELSRVRTRAIGTTLTAVLIVGFLVGVMPIPDRPRATGVVEPVLMNELSAEESGFVTAMPALAMPVSTTDGLSVPYVAKGQLVVQTENPELQSQLDYLTAERKKLEFERNMAYNEGVGKAVLKEKQIAGTEEQIKDVQEQIARLEVRSPISGLLVAPELENRQHDYIKRGDRLGVVVNLDTLIVRAAASNEIGGPLISEASKRVELRVNQRPDILLTGHISQVVPAGSNQLPSPSLSNQAGGSFSTSPDDKQGTKTIENFFEVRIDHLVLEKAPPEVLATYARTHQLPLLAGERVVVRFELKKKPLIVQVWTSMLQLFQKKFQM